MTTHPPDRLIRTIINPGADSLYAAAWALDFGTEGASLVSILTNPVALPRRLPSSNELFLWFGAPRSCGSEELLQYLDKAERAQLSKLRQPADRWSFAAARWGVRAMLATALGCLPCEIAFIRGAQGKPWLDPARHGVQAHRVHFNISHARGLVAVAVAGREVGVDVESVRELEDMHAVAEEAFAAESLSGLAEGTGKAARTALFYRFWTLGEAFIKATGEGLAQGLKSFAFNKSGPPYLTRVSETLSPPTRWRFGVFPS